MLMNAPLAADTALTTYKYDNAKNNNGCRNALKLKYERRGAL